MPLTTLPPRRRMMILIFILVATISTAGYQWGASQAHAQVRSSVVRIEVTAAPPDLMSPWTRAPAESRVGSGVVLEDGRILTNAHVVVDAVSIRVKSEGGTRKYTAQLLQIEHQTDLALLEVKDPAFHKDTGTMELALLPAGEADVQVYGYPIGGESLSVTRGVLSRISVEVASYSLMAHLMGQIDAAVNPGNSGGPVVHDGKVIGIATSALSDAENIAYVTPTPVIQQFLQDVMDGQVDGLPAIGIAWQELENDALRQSLGLSGDQSGILVTGFDDPSPASRSLRAGDVMLSLQGTDIADDGTVVWSQGTRVNWGALCDLLQAGDTIEASVWRDNALVDVAIHTDRVRELVPGRGSPERQQYYVLGGLVFQPLTIEYMELFGDEIPSAFLVDAIHRPFRTPGRQQVVILNHVLPHAVNQGYQGYEDLQVARVNGTRPRDFDHFIELIEGGDSPFIRIESEARDWLVLDRKAARAAEGEISEMYGVPVRERDVGVVEGVAR